MSLSAAELADQAEAHYKDLPVGARPGIFMPQSSGNNNTIGFRYKNVEQAFPNVEPGLKPLGNMILVQIRQALDQTAGGIELDSESRKTERDNTQVAKIIAVGPLAFRNRTTGEYWPEGAWCKAGDFVRIPKYQGDRYQVDFEVEREFMDFARNTKVKRMTPDAVEFVIMKDLNLSAVITGDPLQIRSFL